MEDNLYFFQMEDDLNFFSNGIRPQLFSNGRRPQLFSNGRRLENDDLNLDLLMKERQPQGEKEISFV